jgi:hypothetical protein
MTGFSTQSDESLNLTRSVEENVQSYLGLGYVSKRLIQFEINISEYKVHNNCGFFGFSEEVAIAVIFRLSKG